LVAKGMAANDDGFRPAWHRARDGGEDDGFAEDGAAENVSDLSVSGVHSIMV
jgi:hypothetical protein